RARTRRPKSPPARPARAAETTARPCRKDRAARSLRRAVPIAHRPDRRPLRKRPRKPDPRPAAQLGEMVSTVGFDVPFLSPRTSLLPPRLNLLVHPGLQAVVI